MYFDAQVLSCTDLEPVPQILGARRMEEKDPADRCCGACLSRSIILPSSFERLCLTCLRSRCPNSRFESLRPPRETDIGSPCPACGSNSSGFLPKTESR